MKLPCLTDKDMTLLEQWMDNMDAELPELRAFILPGGHLAVSQCHVARTVCRRAERIAADLRSQSFVETVC